MITLVVDFLIEFIGFYLNMRAGHLLGIQPHMYKHKNHKHLHIVHVDGKSMIPSGTRRHLLTCMHKTWFQNCLANCAKLLFFLLILRQSRPF